MLQSLLFIKIKRGVGDSFHFMIDKVRIERSFLKYGFIISGIEHIVNAIVI
jgi:hypothetical protein